MAIAQASEGSDPAKMVTMTRHKNRSKKGQTRRQPLRPHCRKKSGVVALTYLLNNYRANAGRRGYDFSLEREEFAALVSRHCFYCGRPPLSVSKRDYDSMLYNGIDRLDNSMGYISGNCVACCKRCNLMKGTMTVQEFHDAIAIIHQRFSASGNDARGSESTLNTETIVQ